MPGLLDPTTEEALANRGLLPGMLNQPVPRDPNYVYGSLLPYRKPVAGGPAEWSPMYSGVVKGLLDAFTAPGRAWYGNTTPDDAMNLAMNVQLASAGGLLGRGPRPGELGITAYHGSPYKFDKFDMSKIGTGEGAQAYGHGLYFAENPAVAGSYKEVLGGLKGYSPEVSDAVYRELLKGSIFDDAITWGPTRGKLNQQQFRNVFAAAPDKVWGALSPKVRSAIDKEFAGTLYKVDLPDDQIARMLDWDKPLSQQPEVMAAFRKVREVAGMKNDYWEPGKLATGQMEYGKLVSVVGKERATEMLREAGIPGIRYLDQGSRAGGQGTSNFVVFDENLPKLLERNGEKLAGAYQGLHTPPMADSGAPLHDLTGGGKVYPNDVYGPKAAQYYGHGDNPARDAVLFAKIQSLHNKPDAMVDVWRAVPPEAFVGGKQPSFNHGDWVTISRDYAVAHGESTLNGNYKLMRARFPAKALFTNGDSPYEFGLDRSVLK